MTFTLENTQGYNALQIECLNGAVSYRMRTSGENHADAEKHVRDLVAQGLIVDESRMEMNNYYGPSIELTAQADKNWSALRAKRKEAEPSALHSPISGP